MLRKEDKDAYSIKAVENALTVLEAFSEVHGEIGITRLSETLGLNKSYVFRLIATFEKRGYIENGEKSGKYRLGLSAFEMGQKFLSRMGLLTKARPTMVRLARECNESVYIAVPRGNEVMMLDKVDTTHVVSTVPLVGYSFPLCQAAPGKAIQEQVSCVDFGGFGEGTACVAAPLFNAKKIIPGSLCIVGPEFRLSRERISGELLPRLQDACEEVSLKLGWFGASSWGTKRTPICNKIRKE